MAEETAEAPARKGPPQAEVRRLVDRAQAGDRDALEELYLIHFDRIYSYLHVSTLSNTYANLGLAVTHNNEGLKAETTSTFYHT